MSEQMKGLYKTKDGAALRFFFDAAKNEFQSNKQGRPIYDNVLYVEVLTPGSKESAPVFECIRNFHESTGIATPRYGPKYKEYETQIKAFLDGNDGGGEAGTPLSAWPALDVGQVATLREARVFTVEGLANVPDSQLGVLGIGGLKLRERARAFLAAAQGSAASEATAAELVAAKQEISRLNDEIAALNDRLTSALKSQGDGGAAEIERLSTALGEKDGVITTLNAEIERLSGGAGTNKRGAKHQPMPAVI